MQQPIALFILSACRHEYSAVFVQRLGKGLKDLPRDQVVLGTKVGRYGPNAFANLFDFSAERIQGIPPNFMWQSRLYSVAKWI